MPRYPNAEWRPLPETLPGPEQQPIGTVRSFVIHTHVGPKGGGFRLPPQPGQEYTFDMKVGADRAGTAGLRQYMDSSIRADNNYKANGFTRDGVYYISGSVETGDEYYDGDPGLTKTFTELGQWDSLVHLCAWYVDTHDLPIQWCPDPYGPGFGWHSMWRTVTPDDPHDDTIWTKTASKTCPGAGKIRQLRAELLPAIRDVLNVRPPSKPDPVPPPVPMLEDEMLFIAKSPTGGFHLVAMTGSGVTTVTVASGADLEQFVRLGVTVLDTLTAEQWNQLRNPKVSTLPVVTMPPPPTGDAA
jgi:hypothetical protein